MNRGTLPSRFRLPLVLIGLVGLAFAVGTVIRGEIGDELSLDAARGWVEALGWRGPVLYVVLLTFRQFLFLPSAIVLSVGGLCFGVLGGTLLGGAGIVLSGLMQFGLTRGIARPWFANPGRQIAVLRERIENAGPALIALATAHPLGPMSPAHWAAGLTAIPVPAFVLAVMFGGPLRAGVYSIFGSSLVEGASPLFYTMLALVLGVILLPLAHPSVRRRLFGGRRT